jgi:DNA repair ATPase RecN
MYIVNGKEVKNQKEYLLHIEEANKELENIYKESQEIADRLSLLQMRITELQNKAILEGLTDAEKEEYKKLMEVE